ncbi:MAG: hypothetical protein ACW98Y_10230 [Candidatus Thorarchaeota archaeon]|jgi:hypothetical protein
MTQILSKPVSKIYREGYIVAFLIGFIPLLYLLWQSGWDYSLLMTSFTMAGLFTVSGATMKFLSGIGIMLTYASFCTIIFKMSSDGMKGSKGRAKAIKGFLLVPLVAIAIYGGYKILTALLFNETLGFLEILISLYGVWSLVLSIYILPAIMGKYQPDYKESTTDKIRRRVDNFGYSLWRGYQTKVTRDYGKAYAKEFERYATQMDKIRAQLSGVLLLPLCLTLSVFPPLALVLVLLWIRSFSLNTKPLTSYERIMLIVSVLCVLILSTSVFLTFNLSMSLVYLDTAYGLGIIVSILILTTVVTRS